MRSIGKIAPIALMVTVLVVAAFIFSTSIVSVAQAEQTNNPCSFKNPCSNPCAMKNPCANPCSNPCATQNPCANPCAVKNPCSMKDSSGNSPIRKWRLTDYESVLDRGERLWVDSTLGKSGSSCSTCHPGGALLNAKPYPKYIKMANDILTLDQMINFCMINPMAGRPLKWNSQKMTGLAAYVANHSGHANPCSMKNPCAVNPCSANPCSVNPCGASNPCSMKNPCSFKNPCGR